jgi:hypothetical protein
MGKSLAKSMKMKINVHEIGIQCPKDFCDFAVFNRLAQAGGGALLYDISLPKSQRPKLLLGVLVL